MNALVYRLVRAALGGAALVVAVPSAHAQNTDLYEKYKFEALQFSQLQATGTTRTQSMGGAGSALGADLGSFVLNPANLGTYRRSEVSFSPGLLLNTTESAAGLAREARTTTASNSRSNFNIANFGIVITTRKDDADAADWRSGAVGINFSRLATFSNRRTYVLAGLDSSRSFQEYIVQDFLLPNKGKGLISAVVANGNNNLIENFTDLGYNGFLLNFPTDTTFFTPNWNGSTARQSETTEVRGAVNQIDIGYGASYRDQLYVGGSLGIVTMRYQQSRILTETLTTAAGKRESELASLSLRDGYEVQGGGINLRVGLVYRPNDFIRLGAAIQTPTFASDLKEKTDATTLNTVFRQPFPGGQNSVTSASPSLGTQEFKYSLTTPFRATGGLTLIGKKIGLISADIDYVNYGAARLNAINNDPAQADFSAANSAIRAEYAAAINYRLGAELRLGEFQIRGGYGYYGSPYADARRGSARTVIGGGVGIRREKGYVDVGFARTTYTADLYSPYQLTSPNPKPNPGPGDPIYLSYSAATAAEPVVSSKVTLLNPTVTVGFIIQ